MVSSSKFQCVLADFESVNINGKYSAIHTICLIPATFTTGKLSQYILHYSQGVVIKITDSINDKILKAFLSTKRWYKDTTENDWLNEKHANDINTCVSNNIKIIRNMKFNPAIKFMNKFIMEHGGNLVMHNIMSDLEFLVSTQNLVKGLRIIKNKLSMFPDTGMYDPNWSKIIKHDSMSLFSLRCPNMDRIYEEWAKNNNRIDKFNTLESLTQFVKNDRGYKESHSAVQDTIDLFHVLKYASKCDGPIMDKYSFIVNAIKPTWINSKKS